MRVSLLLASPKHWQCTISKVLQVQREASPFARLQAFPAWGVASYASNFKSAQSVLITKDEGLQTKEFTPTNGATKGAAFHYQVQYFTLVLKTDQLKPREKNVLAAGLHTVAMLRQAGYRALFAGGWVRDQFLQCASYDIDIATNASPLQVVELFPGGSCKLKGGSTCDVTVGGHSLEVTTFRAMYRLDHEVAELTDASRRDFPFNSLLFEPATGPGPGKQQQQQEGRGQGQAGPQLGRHHHHHPYHHHHTLPPLPAELHGTIKDFVAGSRDLEKRCLRVLQPFPSAQPSDPPLLFDTRRSSVEEDPLRVFRAARFMVQFGLSIAPDDTATVASLRKGAAGCRLLQPSSPFSGRPLRGSGVSASRVYSELGKMASLDLAAASGKSRKLAEGLKHCLDWGALQALLPGLDEDNMRLAVERVIGELSPSIPLELMLACLAAGRSSSGALLPPAKGMLTPVRVLLSGARQANVQWLDALEQLVAKAEAAATTSGEPVVWAELSSVLPAANPKGAGGSPGSPRQWLLEVYSRFLARDVREQFKSDIAPRMTTLQPASHAGPLRAGYSRMGH